MRKFQISCWKNIMIIEDVENIDPAAPPKQIIKLVSPYNEFVIFYFFEDVD